MTPGRAASQPGREVLNRSPLREAQQALEAMESREAIEVIIEPGLEAPEGHRRSSNVVPSVFEEFSRDEEKWLKLEAPRDSWLASVSPCR